MEMCRRVAVAAAILATATAGLPASVVAGTFYWDAADSTNNNALTGAGLGGAGNWNHSLSGSPNSNWWPGTGTTDQAWVNDGVVSGTPDTAVFWGTAGTVSLTDSVTVGGLTFNTSAYTISTGANTLTLGSASNVITLNNVAAAAITGAVTGSGNVTLTGGIYGGQTAGTLTLNGTSTGGWSGTTTINNGLTLALAGSNQALLNTTGITLAGGGITLTNTTLAEAGLNRIANGAGITSNGGTITVTNTVAAATPYSETIGSVSLSSGRLNVVSTNANTGGTQLLTLSGLSRSGTASIGFGIGGLTAGTNLGVATNQINITGQATTAANQIIGPWATVGTSAAAQLDYAVYNINGGTTNTLGVQGANIAASAETTWTTAANSYTLSGATTLTGNRTLNSLRYTGNAQTLALGAFNLQTLGILNGGTGLLTISGTGVVRQTTTSAASLYLNTGNNGITISAPINNNTGALTLVKDGTGGTLTLSSTTSTYSGGTVLNAGIISIAADTNLGAAAGDIFFNGNATLSLTTASTTLNAGRTVNINNGALASINVNNIAGSVIAGDVVGTGGLVVLSSGNQPLSLTGAANTFQGPLVVSGSATRSNTVTVSSLADSATANGVIRLGNTSGTGTFVWGTGATAALTLNNRQIELAGSTGGGTIDNSNANAANTITINTDLLVSAASNKTLTLQGANAGSNTFAGRISNGASSTIAVTKSGAGTWILSGANSYTGATTVLNGILKAGVNDVIGSANASGIAVTATGAAVTATYDLNGFNQTLNGTTTLNLGGSTATSSPVVTGVGSTLTINGGVTYTATNNPLGGAIGVSNLNLNGTTRTFTVGDSASATTDLSVSSAIGGGAAGLTKEGAGVLNLSGANSYTGTTTINAGALVYANAAAASSTTAIAVNNANSILGVAFGDASDFTGAEIATLLSKVTFAAGAAFGYDTTNATGNVTLSAAVTGTTGLAKLGTGTLVLDQANTYTGPTVLVGGTLNLGVAETPGTSGPMGNQLANAAGTILFNGGTLQYSAANQFDYSGRFSTAAGQLIRIDTGGQAVTFATALASSTGTLTKLGAGTLTLATTNTYGGATTILEGTLKAGVTHAISPSNTAGVFVTATGAGVTATYDLNGFNQGLGGTTALTLGGTTTTSAPIVTGAGSILALSGNVTYSATNNPLGGVISVANLDLNGATRTFTVGDSTSAAADLTVSSIIAGTDVGVTKAGAGTMRLSGANAYTGITTVSAGTLVSPTAASLATTTSISVTAANATLAVNYGGASDYSDAQIATLLAKTTFAANSAFGYDTTNAAGPITLGAIATPYGIAKLGTGTLILNQDNTYAGPTIISGGTLQIGDGAAGGSFGTGAVTVAAGANLVFNQNDDYSFSNTIAGSGTIFVESGIVRQIGGSSFTGTVIINGGTFRNDDPNNVQDFDAVSIIVNNGGSYFFGNNNENNPDLPGTTYVTANTGGQVFWEVGESFGGINLFGGSFETRFGNMGLDGTVDSELRSGTLVKTGVGGGITGVATVNKTTSGTVNVIDMNISNTGGLNIQEGTLATNVGFTGAGMMSLGTAVNSATLHFNGTTTATNARPLTVNAGGGTVNVSNAAAVYTQSGAVTLGGTLTKSGPGEYLLSGATSGGSGAVVNGGVLNLTGAIGFTGPTQVNAGMLRVSPNAAASTSAISLAAGATLAVTSSTGTTSFTAPSVSLAASGATIKLELATGGLPTAPLLVVSTADGLNLNGGTHTINLTNTLAFTNGTYTLIDYAGAPISSGFNLTGVGNPSVTRATGSLIYDTINTRIDVNVTSSPVKWGGQIDGVWTPGTGVNVGGVNNWRLASDSSNTNFIDTDQVIFDDTLSGNFLVTLPTTVTPASVVVDPAVSTYIFDGPGGIAGATSLVKQSAGMLILATANTYTGGTAINGGVLQLGNGGATGSVTGAIALAAGATLGFNRSDAVAFANPLTLGGTATIDQSGTGAITLSSALALGASALNVTGTGDLILGGIISGTGASAIVKSGAGVLTLSGANTFTGTTTINGGGIVSVSATGNLGAATADVLVDGGTLRLTASTLGSVSSTNRTVTVGPAGATFDFQVNQTFSGNGFSGTGNVIKTGAGQWYVGSNLSTFSGSILVSAGALAMTSAQLNSAAGITVASGAQFIIDDNTAGNWSLATGGKFTFNGDGGGAGALRQIGSGTFTTTFSREIVLNSATTVVSTEVSGGTIAFSTDVTGTGGLTKQGPGTLQVSGVGSYTGTTTVNAGTLRLSGGANRLPTTTNLVMADAAGATFNLNGQTQTVAGLSGGGASGGNISLGAGVFTVNQTTDTTYAGAISGGGSVTKSGGGSLTLSGANTYSGATNLTGGTLILDGSAASNITISSGASLGGHGGTSGSIGGDGSIDPGNSPGIFTAAQTDPTGGLDYNFEFTVANASPNYLSPSNPGNDVFRLTHTTTPFLAPLSASNAVSIYLEGLSLTLNNGDVFRGGFYTQNDSLASINGGSFSFYKEATGGAFSYLGKSFDLLNPADWAVGTFQDNADFGSGTVNGYVTQFTYNGAVTAVPEPGSFLLTGLAALGLGVHRRWKRRRTAAGVVSA